MLEHPIVFPTTIEWKPLLPSSYATTQRMPLHPESRIHYFLVSHHSPIQGANIQSLMDHVSQYCIQGSTCNKIQKTWASSHPIFTLDPQNFYAYQLNTSTHNLSPNQQPTCALILNKNSIICSSYPNIKINLLKP